MKKIITILLVVATTFGFTSCKTLPQDTSSIHSSHGIISELETESFEPSSTEESTVSNESINHSISTTSSAQKPSVDSSTNSSGTLSFGENTVVHPISGLPFKCRADPNTGISWDGVSPIIYTYPDGTTGTEPIEGATYEQVPGVIGTIYVERDSAGRIIGRICTACGKKIAHISKGTNCVQSSSTFYCECCGVYVAVYTCHTCAVVTDKIMYCPDCGKIQGDGTNGTCLQYWASGNDCYNCGEFVPKGICHTCTRGCQYCGKTRGDGTNGTCYRDYFNTTNCPGCGINVAKNTCHTCG